MKYTLLGQDLHETADLAKKYFASNYGAKQFQCEEEIGNGLPLKPTWQATLNGGYRLCIEISGTPFSESLYQFVTLCSQQGLPVRLWVALPGEAVAPTFSAQLKRARELGVGVLQLSDAASGHEFHKPVPLSLFGLRRTEMKRVPPARRDAVKHAEDAFLNGLPDQGCQAICQDLELITRQFAEYGHSAGWWKNPPTAKGLSPAFFQTNSWATMLETMDNRIETNRARKLCPTFNKGLVAGARQYTDWRNSLSHKPKTLAQLQRRDAKLRTMFEATRDLLVDWYEMAKPTGLVR